ncbi:MAG: hypothetical protein ACYTBJ_12120 [Planctomycetota bacterium]
MDARDLAVLVDYWLYDGGCTAADLDRSGFLGLEDFALLGCEWFCFQPE